MRLRNKKTGEIVEPYLEWCSNSNKPHSLAELNEEWEDYEEPKLTYWYISEGGEVYGFSDYYIGSEVEESYKEIGNLFETEEEAEKAVEKLKAWKRLKDKGFEFTGFTHKDRGRLDELEIYCQLGERREDIENMEDVRLLFGGEE